MAWRRPGLICRLFINIDNARLYSCVRGWSRLETRRPLWDHARCVNQATEANPSNLKREHVASLSTTL